MMNQRKNSSQYVQLYGLFIPVVCPAWSSKGAHDDICTSSAAMPFVKASATGSKHQPDRAVDCQTNAPGPRDDAHPVVLCGGDLIDPPKTGKDHCVDHGVDHET